MAAYTGDVSRHGRLLADASMPLDDELVRYWGCPLLQQRLDRQLNQLGQMLSWRDAAGALPADRSI